jgi:hypothetical protein
MYIATWRARSEAREAGFLVVLYLKGHFTKFVKETLKKKYLNSEYLCLVKKESIYKYT